MKLQINNTGVMSLLYSTRVTVHTLLHSDTKQPLTELTDIQQVLYQHSKILQYRKPYLYFLENPNPFQREIRVFIEQHNEKKKKYTNRG